MNPQPLNARKGMSYRHTWFKKATGNKFNARSTMYNGERYDSMKEAGYAMWLDSEKRKGNIKEWSRQITFNLMVNGKKIAGIRPDFKVIRHNGSEEIHEVKSSVTMTDVWKVKWNLLQALHPEYEYEVIT